MSSPDPFRLSSVTRAAWRRLHPAHSLRSRLALAFGGLTLAAMALFVLVIELWSRALAQAEIQLAVARLQGLLAGIGLMLGALFVGIGWLMAGRIARPLADIATAARRLQEGGKGSLGPAVVRSDEIGSLARTLADLVASLNERSRELERSSDELQARLLERTRRLAAITELLALAHEPDELETILERSLDQVLAATHARAGLIHVGDERGARLLAARGFAPEELERFRAARLGDELLRRAIEGEGRDGSGPRLDPGRNPVDGGTVVAPVWVDGEPWGVLTIVTAGLDPVTAEERALLTSVASQIGFLVERSRLRRQAEQVAAVEERNRLARELHDSVTQALYSATLFAEAGGRAAHAGQLEKALGYLDEVGEMSRQALREMRLLVYKLRPTALEQEGLVAALDQRLKAVEGRAGIDTRLIAPESLTLPAEVEDAVYHIAVEALNNGLKHAHAASVTVELDRDDDDCLTLRVGDNGVGFDPAAVASSGGLGLVSMRERAIALGGTLAVRSTPGQGTTISFRLPAAAHAPEGKAQPFTVREEPDG